MLYFENDYCEGAHPAILQKLAETNFEKVSGYGTDPYCASAREKIRAACACPDVITMTYPFRSASTHTRRNTTRFPLRMYTPVTSSPVAGDGRLTSAPVGMR